MSRYDNLMRRIQNGERILIDGATGTEVDRRGVPHLENAWNGGGTLSHPDIVRGIHEDYIRHGAQIVISNTFATHRHALEDAGVADQFEDYNRRAVELALEARERMATPDVLVAGGMSYWTWTDNPPTLDVLGENAAQQAAIMADAGADLLMLEMMIDSEQMMVTLDAAQSSGLPVWVGLTCEPDDTGTVCLWKGGPLSDVLAVLKEKNVPLINIMHTEVKHIDACLDVVNEHWSGPVGVYAHTGDEIDGKWVFDGTITPEDYAANAQRWLGRGVQVIGGCCGIRVDHIEVLRKVV
ncbi:MAG: homocysteine S-methyltransferase family protein [Pseudomonadota bacterium]